MNRAYWLLGLSRPLFFMVLLTPYIGESTANIPRLATYTVSVAFFTASSAVLVGWVPSTRRWQDGLLWAEVAVVTLLNLYDVHGVAPALYTPVIFTFFLHFPRHLWVRAVGLSMAGWLLTMAMDPRLQSWQDASIELGIFGANFAFFGLVGYLLRSLSDQQAESKRLVQELTASRAALERANRQLRESAARQQEMAMLQERQRLAREIHDGVAHNLTALVVQTQAAARLLERAPEQAAAALTRCEHLAREALQETRWAVRALHPSGLEQRSEVEAIRRLARDYELATGMAVEVIAGEGAQELPPDPNRLEQLYRICQEALTNAHRHGQARSARIELRVEQAELRLTICNDGRRPERLEPGVGLKSMAERVGSLGGAIRFEPCAEGFAIEATIPLRQEAVS